MIFLFFFFANREKEAKRKTPYPRSAGKGPIKVFF
jgi:hypothetical protein